MDYLELIIIIILFVILLSLFSLAMVVLYNSTACTSADETINNIASNCPLVDIDCSKCGAAYEV